MEITTLWGDHIIGACEHIKRRDYLYSSTHWRHLLRVSASSGLHSFLVTLFGDCFLSAFLPTLEFGDLKVGFNLIFIGLAKIANELFGNP